MPGTLRKSGRLAGLSGSMTQAASNRPTWVRWWLLKTGLQERSFQCAFYVAFPNALITLGLRNLASNNLLPIMNPDAGYFHVETSVWSGVLTGLLLLTVFRASQAYTRFWQAITSMHLLQIEWLDAFSSILAFSVASSVSTVAYHRFKHKLARLFSLYHAAALLRLVEPGIDDAAIGNIKVLSPFVFDDDTMKALAESEYRFELVGQWIQVTIMEGIRDKVVSAAPPLVSRCFQQLADGNVKFHDALKVKSIPFPPAYQHLCDVLLIMHWFATPFFTCLWVSSPTLASMLAFFSVFTLWSITFVARSIENPFCTHHFIREAGDKQEDFNSRLLVLISPIAGQAPQLPQMSDDECESCIVHRATLQAFFAHRARPSATISDLVNHATRPSKINFRSASRPLSSPRAGMDHRHPVRENRKRASIKTSGSSPEEVLVACPSDSCIGGAELSALNVTEAAEAVHVGVIPVDPVELGDSSSATAPEALLAGAAHWTNDSPVIASDEDNPEQLAHSATGCSANDTESQSRHGFSGGAPTAGHARLCLPDNASAFQSALARVRAAK